jgi:hypothetical protein
VSRSNPFKRKPRAARHTTLVVVEGETDEVFLKHLKINFGKDGGSRVTVRSAHGNGDAVLKAAMHSFEAFDRRVALFDNDWQPQGGHLKAATKRKIQALRCFPCLEGLLLAILGEKPPRSSAECKQQLQQRIGQSLTDPQTYNFHFPLAVLAARAPKLEPLGALLELFNAPLLENGP